MVPCMTCSILSARVQSATPCPPPPPPPPPPPARTLRCSRLALLTSAKLPTSCKVPSGTCSQECAEFALGSIQTLCRLYPNLNAEWHIKAQKERDDKGQVVQKR